MIRAEIHQLITRNWKLIGVVALVVVFTVWSQRALLTDWLSPMSRINFVVLKSPDNTIDRPFQLVIKNYMEGYDNPFIGHEARVITDERTQDGIVIETRLIEPDDSVPCITVQCNRTTNVGQEYIYSERYYNRGGKAFVDEQVQYTIDSTFVTIHRDAASAILSEERWNQYIDSLEKIPKEEMGALYSISYYEQTPTRI